MITNYENAWGYIWRRLWSRRRPPEPHKHEFGTIAGSAEHRAHVTNADVVGLTEIGFGLGGGRREPRGADGVAVLGVGDELFVGVAHGGLAADERVSSATPPTCAWMRLLLKRS